MFFAALCTVYIRYRWLRLVSNEERSLRCCNIMALVLGGLSALGLSLVANFQVTIKNIFFYYLLNVQLFSKSNVNTDYLNKHNFKKSNYGKLKQRLTGNKPGRCSHDRSGNDDWLQYSVHVLTDGAVLQDG